MEKYLDEELIAYGSSDIYPFHMPGHKRQQLGGFTPEEIDITEVEGFDNLHHAEGILLECQRRLARVFGADESAYLVGGSTAGILAAVCGCVTKGGRLLIARNCHKSVYHAAYLTEAELTYCYPERTSFFIQGSVSPGQVKEALRQFPDTQAVVITSPTYDGVVSDIRAIADIVHDREIPLIVDEAHGAHFGFSDTFLLKAIALGADLCVESLHKTLPAYTQSAALHLMSSSFYDAERVRRYLGIFQSSSPSYVLMAGIDRCVRMLEEDKELCSRPETSARSRFGQFERRLTDFYQCCGRLQNVLVVPGTLAGTKKDPIAGMFARDPSKILISAQGVGLSGQQLSDLFLRKYHLQMEMAAGNYVTALTTIMDTDEGFARLLGALEDIDRTMEAAQAAEPCMDDFYGPKEKAMEIAQAMDARTTELTLSLAAGRICAEFVYLYPPGIPLLVPGEVIDKETVKLLAGAKNRGFKLQGMRDLQGEKILVVA